MLNLLFMTLRSGASPTLNIYYRTSFFVHGIAGAALLPVQFHAPCNTSLYNLHNGNKKSLRKVLDKVPNIGYNSSALERVLYIAGWSSSVARRAHNPKAVGSNPAPATIMNESRFSNNFVEKRDLSYLKSLAMWDFSLSVREPSFFQNSLNAELMFLRKATI